MLGSWVGCKNEFECTSCRNKVVGPVSADSANSHHGCFSRVQNAKGISTAQKEKKRVQKSHGISIKIVDGVLQASCMQTMLTPL